MQVIQQTNVLTNFTFSLNYSSPWTCSATVFQYMGNFTELSQRDIDQLITNSSGDVCLLVVDTNGSRITEDFAVVAGGKGGNRRTRDLSKTLLIIRSYCVFWKQCFWKK